MFSSSDKPLVTFVFDEKNNSLLTQDAGGRQFVAFTIQTSKKSKPNLIVSRADCGSYNAQPTVIGAVTCRSFLSSKIDVSIQGRDVRVKRDNETSLSDRLSFEYPPMGNFEWKINQWTTTTSLKLSDEAGRKLARIKSETSLSGRYKLQIDVFVPGEQVFYDMIIVTGLAAAKFHETEAKNVSEASDGVDIVSALFS